MWLYFVSFAALILMILWGLQIIFMQSYYQGMKTREIIRTAEQIIQSYDTDNFTSSLGQTAYQNGISVQITDLEGYIQVAIDANGNFADLKQQNEIFSQMRPTLLQSPKQTLYFTLVNRQLGSKSLVYGTVFRVPPANH